jgi:septal ring factor EnvC (AmiA/AmiB activator)
VLKPVSLAIAFLLFTAGLAADSNTQKLDTVREEIKSLSADLSDKKASRDELYAQLEEQSQRVSALNRELHTLEQQITEKDQTLKQLREVAGIKEAEQQQQLDALYAQMRAAFINAEPSYLEMLLNQQDIATLSRGSTYFHYFHQARQQQLETISQLLSQLNEEQQELLLAQQSLETSRQEQLDKQHLLEQETQKRKATLAALDSSISSQDAKLANLKEEESNLQSLLDRLAREREQQLAREKAEREKQQNQQKQEKQQTANTKPPKILPPPKPNTPFSRLTGKLNWPVQGKLLASYGSPRNLGKLKWQGIVIDSPTGNDVKATAAGRVVFADWLRGFGLLIIIDHGEQYMTLYGNNDALLKQAGETVQPGEIIAQSGEQGIRGLSGLYFEIRHRGNPTNPMKWLAGRG